MVQRECQQEVRRAQSTERWVDPEIGHLHHLIRIFFTGDMI